MANSRRKSRRARQLAAAAVAPAAAAQKQAVKLCTIGCLPDHLLGRILALAGNEHG